MACSIFTVGICKRGCPDDCFSCNECSVDRAFNLNITSAALSGAFRCNEGVNVQVDIDRYPGAGPICGGTCNNSIPINIDVQIVWYLDPVYTIPVAASAVVSEAWLQGEIIKTYTFPIHDPSPGAFFVAQGCPTNINLYPRVEIQDTIGPLLPAPPVRLFGGFPAVNFECCTDVGCTTGWSCSNLCDTCGVVPGSCIPNVCPSCQTCDPMTGICGPITCPSLCETCNPITGICEPIMCPPGENCNPATGLCECAGMPTCGPGMSCIGGVCQPTPVCLPCEVFNPGTGMCDPLVCPSLCENCNPVTGVCEPNVCPPAEACNPVTGACECFGTPSCAPGSYCDPLSMGCQMLPTPCSVMAPCPPGYVCDPMGVCVIAPPPTGLTFGKVCFTMMIIGTIVGYGFSR